MKIKIKRRNFKDITKKWIRNKGIEYGVCTNQSFVKDSKGRIYEVDNKNVILDHSKSEINIATWFAKFKKVNVRMLPRVLNPPGVKTADFIEIASGITWEIKEPIGFTSYTTFSNQFKGQKSKANHFIIDVHLNNIINKVAVIELKRLLNSKRYEWIEQVVLIRNTNIIKVYEKK